MGHRGAPPPPASPSSSPFSARPARSTSSAIGFKQQQDGQALEFVTQEMKGDRELCTAAVAQDWRALEWAGEEMKGDRELCTAAVAQDGKAGECRAAPTIAPGGNVCLWSTEPRLLKILLEN